MPKQDGLFKKLADYLGFGPEEDEDYEDEVEAAAPAEEWPQEVKRPTAVDRRAPVVPITAVPPKQQSNFKVLVVEPRSFEEVQTIVEQMRARRPVILNLESLDRELAQKILNFMNGAICALGGEAQRVSSTIFFFAPQGVDISTMGRGLTGTAIGGGSVDLPPSILEKLTGGIAREETAASRSTDGYLTREESDLISRPSGRAGERERASTEGRPKYDWRSK